MSGKKRVGILAAFLCALVCSSVAQQTASLEDQYKAAQDALTAGNYEKAQEGFESLAKAMPGVAEVHANLGLVFFQEREFAQAVSELRRALQLKPGLTRSSVVLAMSLAELGRYPEALPGLEKGFGATDRETKRMCGLYLERAYTNLGRDSKAVEIALKMNSLFPDDPEVLYHDGKIFGNFAFLTMQRLSQVAPGSVWQHQTLAEAYESQKSYDAAISEYRQVLSLDPHRPGIHYRIGRTLLARAQQNGSQDDTAQALKEFTEELQIDPSNSSAAYEIGEIHRNAGELADAQKFFALALQHHPDFEEAQVGLAAVLTSLRKPQEALPHLQKAVELRPDDEVSWYRLAQVEGMLGNSAEQRKAFSKFQQLHNQQQQKNQAEKQLSPDEVTPQKLDANSK